MKAGLQVKRTAFVKKDCPFVELLYVRFVFACVYLPTGYIRFFWLWPAPVPLYLLLAALNL